MLKVVAEFTGADTLEVYECAFMAPDRAVPVGEQYTIKLCDVLRFHFGAADYRDPVNIGDIVVVREELQPDCFSFVPAVVRGFVGASGIECEFSNSLENEVVQRGWQDFVVLANGNCCELSSFVLLSFVYYVLNS